MKISGNLFGRDRDIVHLQHLIQQNKTLHYLDISDNILGEPGGHTVALALASALNPGILKHLVMQRTAQKERSARALVTSAMYGQLETLDLDNNHLKFAEIAELNRMVDDDPESKLVLKLSMVTIPNAARRY